MKKSSRNLFPDSWVMFKRCLIISLRNPETLLTATLIPFFLILLFGTVFGSISDVGDYNYIDFIVPGIIFQSIAQASQYSAMNVAADMTKGIIDRFRCMSVSKSAVLIGHTGAGVMRGIISNIVIMATAPILGFRPQAGFLGFGYSAPFVDKYYIYVDRCTLWDDFKVGRRGNRTIVPPFYFTFYEFGICSC